MLQVLFRVPMKIEGVDLWLVALAVGLGVALALWMISRHVTAELAESLRMVSKGVAVLGVGAAGGAYWAQSKDFFPDGIPIYGFGMMLFFAFILCTWLGGRRGEYEGFTKETIQDLAIWIFAGGLLGARLTSLLTTGKYPSMASWEAFRNWLYDLFAIWNGGIVLYGAVAGGILCYFVAYFVMYRKRGLQTGQPAVEGPLTPARFLGRLGGETRRMADVAAPAIALGIMLGRVGCLLNGCCFGGVNCADCQLAWAVRFPMTAPPLAEAEDNLALRGDQTKAGFTLAKQKEEKAPWKGEVVTTRVGQVDPDSAADAAGLRPGDQIKKVNGREIDGVSDLDAALGRLEGWKRGETVVTLEVSRKPKDGGQEETEEITFRPRTLPLYATQLYEVISMFLLMLLLLAYEPFRRNPGQVAAVLMGCYGVHRYLNEILRDDPRPKGLESYVSVVLILGGLALWAALQWLKKPERPATPIGDAAKRLGVTPPPEAVQGTTPVMPGP